MAENGTKKWKPFREKDNPDAWLLSYSDMMTLVLGFFIIIVAFSKIDPVKLETVSKSMNEAMDKSKVQQVSIEKLVQDVDKFIKEEQLQDALDVAITPRGVAVSAKGAVLFPSGSAQLLQSGSMILSNMTQIIMETPYNIAVEGHTDNIPISGELAALYPTNWELSAARAATIVRYFIDNNVPAARLRAVGLADTEPVDSNESEEGRAQNRRVVIVFLVF